MVKCSFCGKKQSEVKKLITGHNVAICNECVELCGGIIEEEIKAKQEEPQEEAQDFSNVLKPKEIKEALDDYVIGHEKTKNIVCRCLQSLQTLAV